MNTNDCFYLLKKNEELVDAHVFSNSKNINDIFNEIFGNVKKSSKEELLKENKNVRSDS